MIDTLQEITLSNSCGVVILGAIGIIRLFIIRFVYKRQEDSLDFVGLVCDEEERVRGMRL